MKLWDLPRNSFFTIDADSLAHCRVPPDAPGVAPGVVYRLGSVDGMYSDCTDSDGNVVHVIANASVTPAAGRPA